jgi:hypothetical protein
MTKGFSLLIAVIIIGSVALIAAFSAASLGLGSLKGRIFANQSEKAFFLAEACGEDALLRLHRDQSFSGTTIQFNDGTCTSAVVSSGNGRTISASGTVGSVTRSIEIGATLAGSSVTKTSWKETP